jgi:hypothetical protein
MAPKFFQNRAVASMFESYPGIGIYNSRRPIPMGDGGGRVFGGDRDKVLSARRILVNYFREWRKPSLTGDPNHQVVHAFNETTPRSSVGVYAYKDFLWRDTSVEKGDLQSFKVSHISPGPGYVYARSSWDEDATYFFFKCPDRFTAHQHLDVGHFLIYKHEELAGDGGHYDSFGSSHDVNYHLRTIAHNTILVHDPSETWPGIRAGPVSGNDGGQRHHWPHHNGAGSGRGSVVGRRAFSLCIGQKDVPAFGRLSLLENRKSKIASSALAGCLPAAHKACPPTLALWLQRPGSKHCSGKPAWAFASPLTI